MLMNGGQCQYNFERLGELSRELAHRYLDADDERAKWIIAIEQQYGSAALGGRNKKLREGCF